MNQFRTLRADEIEVRVQQVASNSRGVFALLLLYKDARVDMNMLDEQFGVFGWQREHTFKDGKNYCKVSVKSEAGEWVAKEDVGVESNTEETKGQASDAFKRACVNFGIGRELYTAPKLLVELDASEYWSKDKDRFGNPIYKVQNWLKFKVTEITYDENRNITSIKITDAKGKERVRV